MTVHVGEIHTEVGARPHSGPEPDGSRPPGAREDEWRDLSARVSRLRQRVCAEDFDD